MPAIPNTELLDAMDSPAVLTRTDGSLVHANAAALRLFELKNDSAAQNFWERFAQTDRAALNRELNTARCFHGAWTLSLASGSRALNVHVSLLKGLSKDATLLLGMFSETGSALKMSPGGANQLSLYQSQKHQAIGSLAAGLTHDFNNILTAVISHLDLLQEDLPAHATEHLTYAKTSAGQGAELVRRLMNFSRTAPPSFHPLRVGAIVSEAVSLLERSLDRGIEIIYQPADVWMVKADPGQMMQLVVNLCLHARDALPDGGTLRIELENISSARPPRKLAGPAGNFVRLSIQANPRNHQAVRPLSSAVSENESTWDAANFRHSVSESIVAGHGGWMELQTDLNPGPQALVFLPQTIETPRNLPAPSGVPATPETFEGTESILLVEDDEPVRLVARAVLGYRGYRVTEAIDGADAVEKFRSNPTGFDLVLLDLQMPRLSGWETLSQIKQIDPSALVVLVSGSSAETLVEKIRDTSCAGALKKPYENLDLLRIVRSTLDQAKGGTSNPD